MKIQKLTTLLLFCATLFTISCKKDTSVVLPPVNTSNQFTIDGYTMTYATSDEGISDALRDKFGDTFKKVYPLLAKRFNPSASKSIFFVQEKNFTYTGAIAVALTGESKIIFKSEYFKSSAGIKDIDVVTHEVMHLVQNYPPGSNVPGWVTEGLADYARYVYGVDLVEWKARIDHAPTGAENYTDGYGVSARFFYWIEKKVKPGFPEALDQAARGSQFNGGDVFVNITGQTAAQLWAAYKANPSL
jgi:hypothetical protein